MIFQLLLIHKREESIKLSMQQKQLKILSMSFKDKLLELLLVLDAKME